MKILFVSAIRIDNKKYAGIIKKLFWQVEACERLGHQVLCSYDTSVSTEIVDINKNVVAEFTTQKGLFGRQGKYKYLEQWIVENNINMVYVRFDHVDTIFASFCHGLDKKSIKIILELPTFPYSGERDLRHKKLLQQKKIAKYFFMRLLVLNEEIHIRYAHKYIDLIVTFMHNKPIWNIPVVCIDNGVNVAAVPVRCHKKSSGNIVFGCVANVSVWHALDRFIEGMYNYGTNHETIPMLKIVGDGSELEKLKELVKKCHLGEQVEFLGSKMGLELYNLMDNFDIGLGTLGLHRIGLTIGSTLKTKEYCAMGLPFIYGYDEHGLSGNENFALKLPANDDAIDLMLVMDFAEKSRNNEALFIEMRKLAVEEYDWTVQMKKVLDVVGENQHE